MNKLATIVKEIIDKYPAETSTTFKTKKGKKCDICSKIHFNGGNCCSDKCVDEWIRINFKNK